MSEFLFLETFVSLSLQVCLLVLLTALAACRLKRPEDRDRLWAGCHLALLALTLVAVTLPHLRLMPAGIAENAATQSRVLSVESSLANWIFGVWATGAGISLILLLTGIVRAWRFLRTASPLSSFAAEGDGAADVTVPLSFLQNGSPFPALRDFSGRGEVQLLVSPSLQSPFCWQIHRPLIVLPQAALSLPAPLLRLMVRHELEHLRSGHPLKLFVQRLGEAVFWFHPAVWWASRQAALTRELCSDAAAVQSREEAVLYLRGLLSVLSQSRGERSLSSAGLAFGRQSGFVAERARHLAERDWEKPAVPRRFYSRLLPLLAALLLMGFWLPVNAAASRRSLWSPWPSWSARALWCLGVNARDYEIDGYRLRPHQHIGFRRTPASDSDDNGLSLKPSLYRTTP